MEFQILPYRVKVVVSKDNLYKVKAGLDAQFYGTLKHNLSVEGQKGGYVVFFRGKDRWGIRLSDGKQREAVYISRDDVLQIKHYLEDVG